MDPALRLMLVTAIVVVVGWVPFACFPSVSPSTRDALVRTALDESRYQCVTNPPNEARLQAACVALLDSGVGSAGAAKGNEAVPPAGPAVPDGGLSGSAQPTPEPMNVEQGNAVRGVDGGL